MLGLQRVTADLHRQARVPTLPDRLPQEVSVSAPGSTCPPTPAPDGSPASGLRTSVRRRPEVMGCEDPPMSRQYIPHRA
jgi:hypothetical protein